MSHCQVADGVSLYYEDFGEGPAIVFTPSGQLTHKMWESQVAALAGRYRTIAYDWRGTGNSDRPRDGFTAETAAADLCALIEKLGLGRATLVGHGIGNHPNLIAAATRPDLVGGLVLASAAPWFSGTHEGVAGGLSPEFLEFLARGNGLEDARGIPYAEVCAALSERFLFLRPQSPAVHSSILDQALSWPQFIVNAYARSLRAVDHRARLAQIQCPALVIQGRHDRKSRYGGAVYLAEKIKNARLVTLEDSAHMGQIEEINAFNAAVKTFMETVYGARRAA